MPIVAADASVGVLQVLDKRDSTTFSLRDTELLAVVARQAGAVIETTRVSRDGAVLLRAMLVDASHGELSEAELDTLALAVGDALDQEESAPLWQLAARVAQLHGLPDADLGLVSELLEVVSRRRRWGSRRA